MMGDFDSRWACPKCGSKDVYVSLPSWFMEDKNGDLVFISDDGEADPIFWLCNTCEASDHGEPTDLLKE